MIVADLPSAVDHIVRDQRMLVARLRKQYPNPADFDQYVRAPFEETLKRQGIGSKAVSAILRATFQQ